MKLTRKEREILPYIAVLCLTNKETAHTMGLSHRTVEDHRANILRKMKVRNTVELARKVALGESHGTTKQVPVREVLRPLLTQALGTALP